MPVTAMDRHRAGARPRLVSCGRVSDSAPRAAGQGRRPDLVHRGGDPDVDGSTVRAVASWLPGTGGGAWCWHGVGVAGFIRPWATLTASGPLARFDQRR